MTTEKPHYFGHRQRLKSKFLQNPVSSFEDYELLEILLFSTHPRKDVKPLAKKLLSEFGSINAIINADFKVLQNIKDVNQNALISIKLFREIIARSAKDKIIQKPIIESWKSLLDYCRVQMLGLKQEQLRILFLDKKHQLIADDLVHLGDIENIEIDIKNILQKTLGFGASNIILVHNHPSGNTKPSKADVLNTKKIITALEIIGVKVYDHLIFGIDGNYYSFKSEGLIA